MTKVSEDDVALFTGKEEERQGRPIKLNKGSKKVGLKIHKGKTKYTISYNLNEDKDIENETVEKVAKYTFLGKTTAVKKKSNHCIN